MAAVAIPLVAAAGLGWWQSSDQARRQANEAADAQQRQAEYNKNAMNEQARLQAEATAQQQTFWKENAFPSAAATEAMKRNALVGMNASTDLAQKNFLESASARGIQGGGFMGSGLANIERERQKQYGGLLNQLTQYANTPQFAPQGAQGINALGTGMPAAGTPTNPFGAVNTALGMYSGLEAYKYMNQPTDWTTNYYNTFGNYGGLNY